MKDLGTKRAELYDHPASPKENKVDYPTVFLPLSILGDKKAELGDEVTLSLKGKIEGLEQTKYRKGIEIKLVEGEIELSGESFLGGAK
jgi:hypothetical protein